MILLKPFSLQNAVRITEMNPFYLIMQWVIIFSVSILTLNFRIFKTVGRTDCIIEPFYFVSQSFLILAIIFSRNPTAIQFMNFRTAFMQWIFQGGSWLRLRRSSPSAHNSAKSWLGLCSQIYLQIHKTDSMHN